MYNPGPIKEMQISKVGIYWEGILLLADSRVLISISYKGSTRKAPVFLGLSPKSIDLEACGTCQKRTLTKV